MRLDEMTASGIVGSSATSTCGAPSGHLPHWHARRTRCRIYIPVHKVNQVPNVRCRGHVYTSPVLAYQQKQPSLRPTHGLYSLNLNMLISSTAAYDREKPRPLAVALADERGQYAGRQLVATNHRAVTELLHASSTGHGFTVPAARRHR